MIIIGEKLNGSIPAVAKAIAQKDEAFIRERARLQAEAGATFLDVCASVEEAVEVETLVWMICQIQGVTDTPICIDSPSARTCVRALPFCRRPGLINSVSMEGDKIDTIFPVIADTEWQCVALLCDNDGIPNSVEKRMEVFHAIMERAEQYHIAPSRLHIDPLVVTLSTDQTALTVFAECCRRIKAEYPDIHITSGLSNISYGLPTRKNINYAFMALAMEAGMDSAIVDPTNQQMLGIIYATNALLGRDEFCLEYIRNCQAAAPQASQAGSPAPAAASPAAEAAPTTKPENDADAKKAEALRAVAEAVERGRNKAVKGCVQAALDAGVAPKDILNVGMIDAMDVVGDQFQKQVIFVPQMLAAARAMKSGVEVLKPHLSDGSGGSVGKMILGTVAGDFHDIGKNLVGMMIESAGVEVIDLGVDVPISTFIREIESHPDVTIVGLSALLTTTMPSLRDTVAALKAQPFAGRIRIMVGGAPINQAFADEIGADAYTPDAASAAKKAKELALEMRGLAGEPAEAQPAEAQPAEAQPEANAPEAGGQPEAAPAKAPEERKYDTTRLDAIMALPAPVQDLSRSQYYDHWAATRQKWINYWKHQNTGRPVMTVIARRPEVEALSDGKPQDGGYLGQICQGNYYGLPEELHWKDMEDKYQNAERIVARYRQFCQTHLFLAESFPNLNIDFGPGSLASYLGSDIGFKEDTVWFIPSPDCAEGWEHAPKLTFNPENEWLLRHLALAKECRRLAGDDFFVDMPDLMENVDTLASLRGAQDTLYDLLDEPEAVEKRIKEIDQIYYEYFDRFYDIIKDHEGGNAYTVFQIWGPGRTVKLQCDFSAMMSPEDFRAYIQPSLRQQAEKADCVLYHLDGPDAIKHMDALMEIEGIDALQWTSGDAGPDGTLPDWDVIYDKAILAGKSIWVKVYSGEFEDWLKNVDRIVQKYGSHSLYLMFPEMSLAQANTLIQYAEDHWSDVKGTFCVEHGLR